MARVAELLTVRDEMESNVRGSEQSDDDETWIDEFEELWENEHQHEYVAQEQNTPLIPLQ